MYNTSNWKTFTAHYMLSEVFNLYLRWMTATNFFEVEIIFLLLLCANIRDLGMRRLVPEMKRITKVFFFKLDLTYRLHTWCSCPGCTPWSRSGCSPRSSNVRTEAKKIKHTIPIWNFTWSTAQLLPSSEVQIGHFSGLWPPWKLES